MKQLQAIKICANCRTIILRTFRNTCPNPIHLITLLSNDINITTPKLECGVRGTPRIPFPMEL